MFSLLESKVAAKEENIGAEEFASKLHNHHHEKIKCVNKKIPLEAEFFCLFLA